MFINELVSKVQSGLIRIPSFQRGFVWDADRVAHLMDSIYRGYPFGSLLFWRTRTPLKVERRLGPFRLPEQEPEYPIDYVLDGQQRATSIFGVFQSALAADAGEDDSVFQIYFDLATESTIQDSSFLFVASNEVDPKRHFPLRLLFNPPAYRKYFKGIPESTAEKIDQLYTRFTTAKISVQTFETDDRAAVAIVFERINRLGVELDTLQLLSAWTWSEDFDLQEEFSDLAEELEPFGFKDVGEDSDLLLRCCSAILNGDASPSSVVELNGQEVRNRFEEIKKGILGAIDFLRSNCQVYSASILPFSTILVPLSVFFSTAADQDRTPTNDQRRVLLKWFWRTSFSRRYSKRLEQLNEDIAQIQALRENRETRLGDFTVDLGAYFFMSTFNLATVNTKTFVLLLAHASPRGFVSGEPVQMANVLRDCNKREFHHLFPRKVLGELGVEQKVVNCLANFAVLRKSENNMLGGERPDVYRSKMPEDEAVVSSILAAAICPTSLFSGAYDNFLRDRSALLVSKARELMQIE